MNIKAFFEYESTAIPVDEIFSLTESVLDDLYITSSEAEQFNIYFHLHNEYVHLKNANYVRETAYLCYLISYYLFVSLTPPHSEEIALEFIQEAINLDACEKYTKWLDIVKSGN